MQTWCTCSLIAALLRPLTLVPQEHCVTKLDNRTNYALYISQREHGWHKHKHNHGVLTQSQLFLTQTDAKNQKYDLTISAVETVLRK